MSFTGFFIISQPATLQSVSVGLSESSEPTSLLKTPNALTALQLKGSGAAGDVLVVRWAVGGPGGGVKRPHQSFVRLAHGPSGKSCFFAGSRSPDSDGVRPNLLPNRT